MEKDIPIGKGGRVGVRGSGEGRREERRGGRGRGEKGRDREEKGRERVEGGAVIEGRERQEVEEVMMEE